MVYPESFEQKIGFKQIRNKLISFCTSELGIEQVNNISFSNNFNIIKINLDISEEFFKITKFDDQFPDYSNYDIRHSLKRLQIKNTWIDEETMLKLKKSLTSINNIVFYLKKEKSQNEYPNLYNLAESTETFPEIVKNINKILTDTGEIKDNASKELLQIRQEIKNTAKSISGKLTQILRRAQKDGYIEKDTIPSIREGRQVIPVSPANKRKINGIVHDESATGKTIFIEPAELVEQNNKIRELKNDEHREIIKILTTFADSIRETIPYIIDSYTFIGKIEFLNAKAKLTGELYAINPTVFNKCRLNWIKARHPLLQLSSFKNNKKVIPLNISLTEEKRILIISGPNAGGKSVCLKTVGLLQYMLQCGLMIPVKEDSEAGIFDNIFINIGDEQSIENDLSTYSSHLLNLKFCLKNCQEKTLILIDEFGSGTEPKIGGAIAEACLEKFNRQKSYAVITTHYDNLKNYANEHDGIINGAMLYDRHEMKPLFILETGRPGSSFAIEIARKTGLPEEIISYASEKAGTDYINIDKYLQDIVRDKRYWERKRQNIHKQEKDLTEITQKLEKQIETINKEKKEIISKAKKEAEELIQKSNAAIENTIRQIKEAKAEKEKTKSLRKDLSGFKEEIQKIEEEKDYSKQIEKIKRREKRKQNKKDRVQIENKIKTEPKKIQKGDSIKIIGQSTIGTVLDIKGEKANVIIGNIKSTLPLNMIELANNHDKTIIKQQKIKISTSDDLREKKLNFKQQIDIRGMRAEEGLQAATYFIDDAILTGVSTIRILHGTGTGALRQIIRQYLNIAPGVSKFYDEHVDFGGAGITVIELE